MLPPIEPVSAGPRGPDGVRTARTLLGDDELFRTMFEFATIAVKVVDLETSHIFAANSSFERLLGYSLDELVTRPYSDYTHPDDRANELRVLEGVVTGRATSFQIVKRYVRKDGSEIWVRKMGSLVRDETGRPLYEISMAEDVSREREADEGRREAEEAYRRIVETTMEGIWLIDSENRTTFVNEALTRMLETTAPEMHGRSIAEFCDEEELAAAEESIQRIRAGAGERFESKLRRRDGAELPALLSANPIFDEAGTYIGALAMVRDETDIVRSREAVAARVRQLEVIADLGHAIVAGSSLEEVLERVGPAVARALKADFVTVMRPIDGALTPIAGFGWETCGPGEKGAIPAQASQAAYQLQSGEAELVVDDLPHEQRFTPPRELVDRGIRGALSCLIDGQDGPFGVLAVYTYVPQRFGEEDASFVDSVANLIGGVVRRDHAAELRRQDEEELRRTADRFRMLAENAQDIVFRYRLLDDRGFDYISPVAASILGIELAAIYADGNLVLNFLSDDDAELVVSQRGREHRGPLVIGWNHPGGGVVWLERRTTFIHDDYGRRVAIEGIIRDVTERVEQEKRRDALEEQLRQSQRLESIGQLAGGIAHDFNNLLFAIRGFGELALRRVESGEGSPGADIEDLLEATDRAAQLTRQLLAFGRRQILQPEVIDLRQVVAGMEKLVRQLIGEHVELAVAFPESPVFVEVDRSQLEQVIANLAVNARDAMPDGGRLSIDVAFSAGEPAQALLAVTDDGCGMDAETARSVFEPFFSTKGGAGSGLGLATVHGIVSQSGGRIVLDTEVDSGSTFSVFLPLSEATPTASPTAPVAMTGEADTILVVEDDEMVRTIAVAMLEDLGYGVLAADGGVAALELAAQSPFEIDVVLTDLVLPEVSGREIAERVRSLFPKVKVLYMSGYTDDVVIRGGAFEPGTAFIQKPFGAEDLARALRDVLELELA